jgi:hypothetical protein
MTILFLVWWLSSWLVCGSDFPFYCSIGTKYRDLKNTLDSVRVAFMNTTTEIIKTRDKVKHLGNTLQNSYDASKKKVNKLTESLSNTYAGWVEPYLNEDNSESDKKNFIDSVGSFMPKTYQKLKNKLEEQ